MRLDLINEYRLNINPVILRKGIPLFAGVDDARNLRLLETKTLSGGIVVLRYEPIRD